MTSHILGYVIGAFSALLCDSFASASYVDLTVALHSSFIFQGTLQHVCRVYATFSNSQDYVISIGSSAFGNIVIQNRNSMDTSFGNGFHNDFANHSNGGLTAPSQGDVSSMPLSRWDSFVTIGVDVKDSNGLGDLTMLSPNFAQQMNNLIGNNLESNSATWFTQTPVEQGRAGHWANNRVMIMQLTVNAGQNVRGTVAITGINADALASEFTAVNQTFNSFPTPPVFALFALGALTPPQRRRRG